MTSPQKGLGHGNLHHLFPAKTLNAAPSLMKSTATIFWDHKGVLLVDFLDWWHWNYSALLWYTWQASVAASRHHFDSNIRPQTTNWTWLVMMPWLGGYGPPFLLSWSRTQWFAAGVNVKQAVTSWLHTLDKDILCVGIQALVPQWAKCLNCQWWLHGDLMCTICYVCAMYTVKWE